MHDRTKGLITEGVHCECRVLAGVDPADVGLIHGSVDLHVVQILGYCE